MTSKPGYQGCVVFIDQRILLRGDDSRHETVHETLDILKELSQFYRLGVIIEGDEEADEGLGANKVEKVTKALGDLDWDGNGDRDRDGDRDGDKVDDRDGDGDRDWDQDLDAGAIFSDDLVIEASQLKYPLKDRRSFMVAAALAGERPENCIFVSSDFILLISATAAGMKTVSFPEHVPFSTALRKGISPEMGIMEKMEKAIDEDKGPTFVLKGRLVTMNPEGEVFDEARIVISGGKIAEIVPEGRDISPEFRSAMEIDTGGTIYPGLIDLHNHFVYNVLPLWPVTRRFTNRSQWAGIKAYIRDIRLPILALADSAVTSRAVVRYVEVKALMGGTTTGQGIRTHVEGGVKIFRGAMRNVEETDDPRLPEAGTRVPDLALTEDKIESFRRSLSKYDAYFYHLAEGVGDTARKRFLDLASNKLVQESLVGVHSLGLLPEDLSSMAEKRAKVVWSPFSNLLLYGKTLDLRALKDSGAMFCIGCDWSPTGGKNLLQELKVARYELKKQRSVHGDDLLSIRDLAMAVTCNPAAILGWDRHLGSLKPGAFADLLVIKGAGTGTAGTDPYDHLIDATERDIRLVVVHGIPRYGIKDIMQRLHSERIHNDAEDGLDALETIAIGGEKRSLYLYAPGSSLNDMTFEESRKTLAEAMSDLPLFLQSIKEENSHIKAMGFSVEEKFRILPDNELEEPETMTFDMSAKAAEAAEAAETDWSKIAKSVELDMPEVDSPSYWERLKDQKNIDDDLKQMLKDAYAS